jgi:hypothetical protein
LPNIDDLNRHSLLCSLLSQAIREPEADGIAPLAAGIGVIIDANAVFFLEGDRQRIAALRSRRANDSDLALFLCRLQYSLPFFLPRRRGKRDAG